jgi:site-specific recombinase XerD
LRYAGKISANPANGIRVPKLHRRLVENIPDVEVSKLIEHLEAQRESPIALRDCAMIYTLYDSGLRVSELISLRLVDLNFSCAALRVIGKGDKQRLAPLSPPQILALKAYLERSRPALIGDRPEHGVVFVNAAHTADAVRHCPKAGSGSSGPQDPSSPVAPLFRFNPDRAWSGSSPRDGSDGTR